MQIASRPDPEFPERRHEVLWLLTDERGDAVQSGKRSRASSASSRTRSIPSSEGSMIP